MGRLARAVGRMAVAMPQQKLNVGAQIPTWEDGTPQYPRYWHNYFRFALEGYSRNEIVFACVEELSTSAAEPRLAAYRKTKDGPEQIKDSPVLDLFDRPNPFMSRYELIAAMIMYRAVAGNAFLYKTRSAAGKVVELWPLRPDRMFVIPDRRVHIRGWEYRLESETFRLAADDVIHFKTRNPLDDWYGLPPLAVCAERVDTDAMMRSFTLAFFRNAAVPAGLLNITKQVTAAERQIIRDKFRSESGGPQNWHQMMVLDNMEAKYTPMGLPLGDNGIILPGLDEISEARIAMAYGVPLELIGARTSATRGSLGSSKIKEARAGFWDETLVPLYLELGSCLSMGLQPDFDHWDYLDFDLSTVKALSEDEDAKHTRVRADLAAGIISVQQARTLLGYKPEYESGAILLMPETTVPTPAADLAAPPPAPAAPVPTSNGHTRQPVDMDALRALAAGRDQ